MQDYTQQSRLSRLVLEFLLSSFVCPGGRECYNLTGRMGSVGRDVVVRVVQLQKRRVSGHVKRIVQGGSQCKTLEFE